MVASSVGGPLLDPDTEREPDPAPGPSRATAFPADLLEALRGLDLTLLAPRAVLHVHLHEAATTGSGVARVEGLGPMTLTRLQGLLARTSLVVRPVLDLSRRVRTTAYDDTGPPGQTGSYDSGPLGRRHHWWRTHAGYRSRQCGEGRYVWITPHGSSFLVDHRGTRAIDHDPARMMFDAPPGVDVYPV